jgi:REP element-mobilizing transposase RayT
MARPPRHNGISYIGRERFLITAITRNRVKAFADVDFGRLAAAELLRQASTHEFALPAYTFMEDHVHVATKGLTAHSDLCRFIAEWKKSAGYLWSKRGFGRLWQPGFWDRRARFDESPLVMLKYVVENPVRAKLVDHPTKYVLTGSTEFTIEEICAAIAGDSGGTKVPPSR